VESTELGADDQEHSIQWLRILGLWQEAGIKPEAECHLCGCIEVGLEHAGIEYSESGHDHFMMLIDNRLGNHILELLITQDLVHLESKIAQGRNEIILFAPGLHVVGVRECKIERANKLGVLQDDLEDVVCGEGLCSKSTLDL
jgi:hypothetical protein